MYNKSAIKDLQSHIDKAVDKVFQDIVDDFPKIQGREEEITSYRFSIRARMVGVGYPAPTPTNIATEIPFSGLYIKRV